MVGKGSKPRPLSVSQKTFDSNWDKIFGSGKKGKELTVGATKKNVGKTKFKHIYECTCHPKGSEESKFYGTNHDSDCPQFSTDF